jgi:hypothetical protein
MANEELLVSPIGDISGDVCHWLVLNVFEVGQAEV